MNTYENFNQLKNSLPIRANGRYGRKALNILSRAGYAYVNGSCGQVSALHDQGNYLGVMSFISSCNDFYDESDVDRAVRAVIEHIDYRGDKIDSY